MRTNSSLRVTISTAASVIIGLIIGAIVAGASSMVYYGGQAAGTTTITSTTTQTTTPTRLPSCQVYVPTPYLAFTLKPSYSLVTGQAQVYLTLQNVGNKSITSVYYVIGSQQVQAPNLSPSTGGMNYTFDLTPALGQYNPTRSYQAKIIVDSSPITINLPPLIGYNCELSTQGLKLSFDALHAQSQFLTSLLNKLADETKGKSDKVAAELAKILGDMATVFAHTANATEFLQQNKLLCNMTIVSQFDTRFRKLATSLNILDAYEKACAKFNFMANPTSQVSLDDVNQLMMDLIELDNTIANDP